MNAFVIIHGPLITFGQGPNNVPLGFDAVPVILENHARLKHAGLQHHVATASPGNEREAHALKQISQAGLRVHDIRLPPMGDPDHRFKHHWGVLSACKSIEDVYNVIIKIRTDMLLPASFWTWVQTSLPKILGDKLLVSELYRSPWCMGDFIYGGTPTTLTTFLETVVAYREQVVHPCIVVDTAMKYALGRGCPVPLSRMWGVLPFLYDERRYYSSRHALWNQFATGSLTVVPKELWFQTEWRGRTMPLPQGSGLRWDTRPLPYGDGFTYDDLCFALGEFRKFTSKRCLFAPLTTGCLAATRIASSARRLVSGLRRKQSDQGAEV